MPRNNRDCLRPSLLIIASLLLVACAHAAAAAQGGGHMLYGDFKVDESKAEGQKPLSFDLILYSENGPVVARQTVASHGSYRFLNLANGWYALVVEVEGTEVARLRVQVVSTFKTDFRQDISMEWRGMPGKAAGNVSVADFYKRATASQKLYDRAAEAMGAKRYADATALLLQVVGTDTQDYQAWTELGTSYLFQDKADDAERAYLRAAEAKPTFALAYVNLGRMRLAQKNYDAAIEVLTKAVALQPPSADANFLLGEAYLQLKKGSKAVPYMNEAARLGRADAHLRLATLYNAAGMKDRAAAEYEQYLAKKPDAPDRKKLEQYVKENKKQ
jgi:Flp pilus assembly protein TadD